MGERKPGDWVLAPCTGGCGCDLEDIWESDAKWICSECAERKRVESLCVRLAAAEKVVEAARAVDESRAALQKLNAEAYRLPTPEYERLGDIAYDRSARLERLRDAIDAYDAAKR
jgi:hypothetical protein